MNAYLVGGMIGAGFVIIFLVGFTYGRSGAIDEYDEEYQNKVRDVDDYLMKTLDDLKTYHTRQGTDEDRPK